MINPNSLHPGYIKVRGSNYGVKEYKPAFTAYQTALTAKRVFKKAEEANEYAKRLVERWIRLYNAAILAEVKKVDEVLKVAA